MEAGFPPRLVALTMPENQLLVELDESLDSVFSRQETRLRSDINKTHFRRLVTDSPYGFSKPIGFLTPSL
jgi:hypothetical protein